MFDKTRNLVSSLPTYTAVCVVDGGIRRMWFEAPGESEARDFARRCGAGLTGASLRPADAEPLPEAYDEKTARTMLGGISRATLYRFLSAGKLDRVSGTRKVLVTRQSIERRCRQS